MSSRFKLTAQQDHYLKNELVKQQLKKEFADAWNDNVHFLENLGYPFSDPALMLDENKDHEGIDMSHNLSIALLLLKTASCQKTQSSTESSDGTDKYPLLKFVFLNLLKTFPYFRNLDSRLKLYNINDTSDIKSKLKISSKSNPKMQSWSIENQAQLLDGTNNNIFFRSEIMPFFQYMLNKNISLSSSVDRDELTKRKKVNMKIFRVLLLLLNSSLATTREGEYYSHERSTDESNLSIIGSATAITKLTGDELNKKIVNDLENSLNRASEPHKQGSVNLQEQSFQDFKDKYSENQKKLVLVNGCFLDIIGVTRMKINKKENKIGINIEHDNSSTKLGDVVSGFFSFGKRKSSKADNESTDLKNIDSISMISQTSLNSDNEDESMLQSQDRSSKKNLAMVYKFIIKLKYKSYEGNIKEHIVYRSYSEFKVLHHQLKKDLPGIRLPALPHKYKHSTMLMNTDEDGVNEDSIEDQEKNILLDSLNNLFSLDAEEVMDEETRNAKNERVLNYILNKDNFGEKRTVGKVMKTLGASNKDNKTSRKQNIIELPREKLRVLLNHYLNACLAEVIRLSKTKVSEDKKSKSLFNIICDSSSILNEFLTDNKSTLDFIKPDELEDISLREKVSFKNFQNEIIFQKGMYLATLKLKNELSDFKNMIIFGNNEEYLNSHFSKEKLTKYEKYWKLDPNDKASNKEGYILFKLMDEFKANSKLSEFPPIFNILFKWGKLSISSFLYNLFFTSNNLDGSKIYYVNNKNSNSPNNNDNFIHYELFNQIKKMHFIFPYTMISQIIKISNPIIMIKRLLDFLLYQPPSLIPGFLNNNRNNDDKSGKSLLQFLFRTILSHDISNLTNEMNYIMQKHNKKGKQDMQILNFVSECFDNFLKTDFSSDSEKEIVHVKDRILDDFEKNKNSKSLILLILSEDKLLDDVSYIRMRRITNFRQIIKQSFKSYERLQDENGPQTCKHSECTTDDMRNSELYEDIKKVFQLKVRAKDKEIIESIWEEPYLNNFLKKFLLIFFEPLIIIFSKNKTFKRSVSVFKNFMNDLIKLLDYLYEYLYLMNNGNEILLSIYLVISKYEDFVIEFIHESYLNDTENFFGNMIIWVSDILSLMKFFKNGELHKIDGFKPQFDIEGIIDKSIDHMNIELLRKEIDHIIAEVVSNKLSELSFDEDTDSDLVDDVIEKNWKKINNINIMERGDLNIFENNDLDEFYKDLDDLEKDDSEQEIADSQDTYESSEIHKLETEFKKELINILMVYQANSIL